MFKSYVMKTAKDFTVNRLPNLGTKIAIHARRGDDYIRDGQVVANASYINKAMKFLRRCYKHTHFVVGGDDIQWCRKNIVFT